jgi:NADH-quinone oxidoreductase subunit F
MTVIPRVLDAAPVRSLHEYHASQGGRGLQAARRVGPEGVVAELAAAGLRGRGGAGFPTATKWRAVLEHASTALATTVVVNAAEGEPGSFKDRTLLRTNPYRVLEGALIAAHVVGARQVIVALKRSFVAEIECLRSAIADITNAGWAAGVALSVVEGPEEYLFGEETALLEVLDGRPPFPRIAPPFRHGVVEVGDGAGSTATVSMAEGAATIAPPTLVNNTETIANVPLILANGADWFRAVGTEESPGTIVCTVSGDTVRAGVGEVAVGTPVRDIIEAVGGGSRGRSDIAAVLSGVAHPLLPADLLETPATYEDLDAVGSGLGAAGFIVFDEDTDLVAVVQGVARFLGVESCGQCTPCKRDGLAIAELLASFCRSEGTDHAVEELGDRVNTVTDEARCFLAHQQQRVVGSLLRLFPDDLRSHLGAEAKPPVEPVAITPLKDIVDGRAVMDDRQPAKQPDWTYDETDSGRAPADRIDERAGEE